jgi:hypothetical protein
MSVESTCNCSGSALPCHSSGNSQPYFWTPWAIRIVLIGNTARRFQSLPLAVLMDAPCGSRQNQRRNKLGALSGLSGISLTGLASLELSKWRQFNSALVCPALSGNVGKTFPAIAAHFSFRKRA